MFDLNSSQLKLSAKFGLAVTLIVALGACAHKPPMPEWSGTPISDVDVPPAVKEPATPAVSKPARRQRSFVPASSTGAMHKHHAKKARPQFQARHHVKPKTKIQTVAKAKEIQAQTVASVGEIAPPPPPAPPTAPAFEPSPIVADGRGASTNLIYIVGGLAILGAAGLFIFRGQIFGRGKRQLVFNS